MVTRINPEFVERYQILFEKDPTSRVFAPLADAYRKMGLIERALEVGKTGIEHHPDFPGGHVSLARIYLDLDDRQSAIHHLQRATELSPENILAHGLLAETLMKNRRPKEALSAYKMVLFLNPNDTKAAEKIRKLESLTADEYDDDVFEMKKLAEALPAVEFEEQREEPVTPYRKQRELERGLSLIDAFLARADFDRALSRLENLENLVGEHPEITKRRLFMKKRSLRIEPEAAESIVPLRRPERPEKKRVERLRQLLMRIEERRYPSTS